MALPVFQRTIVTEAGDVIAGAEVEVVLESTGLAADIFSDRGGNTALTNPFFTGADGFAKFFAAPDEYRITATGPTGSIVFRFVVLTGDIARQDANSVNVTGGTVNPTTLQQGGSPAYVRSNILGTVSQSGGVPTGAIIQRGSNANGEFVRYADGTLICTFKSATTSTDVADGNIFRSGAAFVVVYPSVFISSPSLNIQTFGDSAARVFAGNSREPQETPTGFTLDCILSPASGRTGGIHYTAIGKWF